MGTWGVDTFENDSACDWSYDLEKANDLAFVESTLRAVLDPEAEFVDADAAVCALAACEVIARLKGNFGARDGYTQTVDEWVGAHAQAPPPALIDLANRAIDAVLGDTSELRDLWTETELTNDWLQAVEALRRRVTE
ncbi:MAG: DUF4259 domain-containing protein [Phycisphaerae bacterium]|nr:DUF4259 domain-containing protein [Phycisphaerae bacterium]NUQ45019.1 DUF4259 domain-containing protein [Phycisphaerae bacterium]